MISGEVNSSDLARLDYLIKEQAKRTSKTNSEFVAQKGFDASRFALKATGKADVKTIRQTLNAPSSNYPDLKVQEVLACKKASDGEMDLSVGIQEAGEMFRSKRLRSVGFAKSGWIPPLKEMAKKVFKSSLTVEDVLHGKNKGGSHYKTANLDHQAECTVFNDVAGSPASSVIEQFKNKGADAAVKLIIADIEGYLEKKLGKQVEHFNQG